MTICKTLTSVPPLDLLIRLVLHPPEPQNVRVLRPLASCEVGMVKDFLDELPQRVQFACRDVVLEEYSLYVRLARTCLEIDRARLAEETGLDRSFLAFLENGLLRPDELTGEVRDKIERTLGMNYDQFRRSEGIRLAELQPHWAKGRRG